MLRVGINFDDRFCDIYNSLNNHPKYSRLVELEGLDRDHLDLGEMSKKYFTNGHIADVSIDANANANDSTNRSPNNYQAEILKGILKLEGYFLLWKYLSKEYGEDRADELIINMLKGDYYFHDSTGVGVQLPYTYSPFEVISVSNSLNADDIDNVSFKDLYKKLENTHKKQVLEDGVEFIIPKELYVYDQGLMVKVKQITKKKRNNKKMFELLTSDGNHQIVTCDHPIITQNRGEIEAQQVKSGDVVSTMSTPKGAKREYLNLLDEFSQRFLYDFDVDGFLISNAIEKIIVGDYTLEDFSVISETNSKNNIPVKLPLDERWGYLIGFYIAEGFVKYNSKQGYVITLCQNPGPEQEKIKTVLEDLGIEYSLLRDNTRITIYNKALAAMIKYVFEIGDGANNKNLPLKWKSYDERFLRGVIEGIIDGDGTVFDNKISIRMSARTLIIQLKDLLNELGIKTRITRLAVKDREGSYKSKYPIYSINLAEYEDEQCLKDLFGFSHKVAARLIDRKIIKRAIEIADAGSVIVVEAKELELKNDDVSMDYIYDITTETGTFVCNNIHSHNCFAYSTGVLMNAGREYGQLKSKAPKRARSFIGQVVEATMDLSQEVMGAVAIGDVFVNYAYYAKREKLSDKEIENDFQTFVHILNNQFRVSGQSLRWDEKIFLNGQKHEIGTFINKYVSGEGVVNIEKENIFTHSFNINTGKVENKKIKALIAHKRKNPIYNLTLSTGQQISVTEDHSIFSIDSEGSIREAKPLQARNVIVPFSSENKIIDEFYNLSEEERSLGRKSICAIPLNKDTMFLFGVYLGDGNIDGSSLELSVHNEELADYLSYIGMSNFGATSNYKNGKLTINVGKSVNAFIFKHFGYGSKEKFIDDYFKNHELSICLVAGYIQADGDIAKDGSVFINSVNQDLLADVQRVLLSNKIISTIHERVRDVKLGNYRYNDHKIYRLYVQVSDAGIFKDFLFNKRNYEYLKNITEKYSGKKHYDLSFVPKLLNNVFKKMFPKKLKDLNLKLGRGTQISPDYDRVISYLSALRDIDFWTVDNYADALQLAAELGLPKSLPSGNLKYYDWIYKGWDLKRNYGLASFLEAARAQFERIQQLIERLSVIEKVIPIKVVSCKEVEDYTEKDKIVYDISVEDNENFLTGNNIYAHNSPFTNISIFDRNNLKALFGEYRYPDGSEIDIEYIMHVQRIFAKWFSKGDPGTGLPYRFPIVTAAFLVDEENGALMDEEFLDMVSKINLKTGFLNIYHSNHVGKIASCCRLSNDFTELAGADSFGNGGLNIGSGRVITLNLPRLAYEYQDNKDMFYAELNKRLEEIKDILNVHRKILHKRAEKGFLKFIKPLGWMNIDKMLFSTIGLIGIYECLEILGVDMRTEEGVKESQALLETIRDKAREFTKRYKVGFNVEQTPGESAAVKFAEKDRIMFGKGEVNYKLYSNQFIPLWEDFDLYDRVKLDGHFSQALTGGGITHLNVSEKLKSPAQMRKLIRFAIDSGCEHFAVNYGFGQCENGHIHVVGTETKCPECGAKIEDHYTRVVGYFTKVSSWHKIRREYEFPRRKFGKIAKV